MAIRWGFDTVLTQQFSVQPDEVEVGRKAGSGHGGTGFLGDGHAFTGARRLVQ